MFDIWYAALLIFLTLNVVILIIHSVAIVKGILTLKQRKLSKNNIILFNGFEDLETWPTVSIIKPIVVDSPQTKSLLETYFQLDYPNYEMHFCFQSSNHSCINYISQLSQQYPRIKVFIYSNALSEKPANRKIINLGQSYNFIRGELVWIVDESIQVTPTTLKEMVIEFDDQNIGCVHQIPLWKYNDNIENTINTSYFSGHHSKFYMFSDMFGIHCISGMSMLLDKEKLDEIGGLKPFEKFLAEDYALVVALAQRGYKMKLANSTALQNPSNCSVKNFIDRMTRWTKIRFNIHFLITLLEPTVHPLLYSIISAITLSILIDFPWIFIFPCFMAACFTFDQIIMKLMWLAFPEQGPLPGLTQRIEAFLIMQFVLIPYVFVSSFIGMRKVFWHNIEYNITWNSIIVFPEETENKKMTLLLKRFKKFKELRSTKKQPEISFTSALSSIFDCFSEDLNAYTPLESSSQEIQQNEPIKITNA